MKTSCIFFHHKSFDIWHFQQIVHIGNNKHEMSKPLVEKIFQNVSWTFVLPRVLCQCRKGSDSCCQSSSSNLKAKAKKKSFTRVYIFFFILFLLKNLDCGYIEAVLLSTHTVCFEHKKAWHFMWIFCRADESHRMSSQYTKNKKKNNAEKI